ncbi:MAG: hypothetical protein ACI4GD_11290 [Lachnospiraceae bacterium]
MNIQFAIKKAFEKMFRRKINFIMTLSVLAVTVYLLASVFQMFFKSTYYIYETKKALSYDSVLNFTVFINRSDMGYFERVGDFDKALKEQYGNRYGRFMYLDASMTADDGKYKKFSTLYVDEGTKDLCGVEVINEIEPDSTEYLKGYAGYNVAEKYPVGTILYNKHTGSRIEIVGILKKNSGWISEPPLVTQNAVVSLDDYIMAEMDEKYFELEPMFYGNIFNSMYIKCQSEEDAARIKEEVRNLADEYDVICYCNSINSLIRKENMENARYLKSMGYLIGFVVIMAVLAYFTSGMADIYSEHYEFAVMLINNVAPVNICIMLLVENLIKGSLAVLISLSGFGRGLKNSDAYVFNSMVFPAIAVLVFVFMILISLAEYMTIRNKNVCTMLGGDKR